MIARTASALLFSVLVALPTSGHACALGFKPETSGFALNPILNKLTVTDSKVEKPGDTCSLHVNDEILRVNSMSVPGARALAVMRYWKSLPKETIYTFIVRRAGVVTTVTSK